MERLQQIEEIFHQALQREPRQREAFVRQACRDDSDLLRQVVSLLENHDESAASEPWAVRAAAELIESRGSLKPGQSLGPYRIDGFLAAGGMGEVYRATDTRLNRHVAIKVSAAPFTDRFEREARMVASLNHPNICTLHDVGPNYLVMELVEGPALDDRIRQGALPTAEALAIARQIAEALEAAHERGIVHRDLKPGNVKITPEGIVKVLDFGLAKTTEGQSAATTDATNSPTLTISPTRAGVILGTAAYMSPEQVRGNAADRRSDIWAFGVVLYEMLAGKRLFSGESVPDILANVLRAEPDWSALPAATPPRIRKLLRRCLERDRKQRLQAIGEARIAIDAPEDEVATRGASSRLGVIATGVAILFFVVAAVLAFIHFHQKPAAAELVRFQIAAPGKSDSVTYPVMSPNGRMIAFFVLISSGRGSIWVRSFDALDARPLPGTESYFGIPFWSPDSRFLAFVADNKLKKVEVSGGEPQTLCDVPGPWRGGAWSRNGVIVFGSVGNGLMRVAQSGGAAYPLTALDPSVQETGHFASSFLPDGRHFVFFRNSRAAENRGLYVGSLDAKPEQQKSIRLAVPAPAVPAHYVPSTDPSSGYLLFQQEGALMAQPFNTRRLQVSGEAVLIPEDQLNSVGPPQYSASENGVLAYFAGESSAPRQLTWFDRNGNQLGTVGEQGQHNSVVLSPDGTRAAVSQTGGSGNSRNADIWVHDFAHGTLQRVTSDPSYHFMAVWSPDGSRIAFATRSGGVSNLYQKVSNGAGSDDLLFKSGETLFLYDWSPDGEFLLYGSSARGPRDLWYLPLVGNDRRPKAYLQTQFSERQAQFSPDGRFVAYTSDETGRNEIYVRPFPQGLAGKWLVSTNGGTQPRWRRDGKELFYISADSKMMTVAVTTTPEFKKLGNPKAMFTAPVLGRGVSIDVFSYDVTRDGQKFLLNAVATDGPAARQSSVTVVLNWPALLRK